MDTLTLKVTEPLKIQLDRYADKKGLSKSEIIRNALEEYFARDSAKSAGSFMDLASDLISAVEGPSDLSTNKKYLKDYGK